jgi:hypothetical protein
VTGDVQGRSRRSVVAATVGAATVATLVLVVAVLPAEYGIDPLGVGKALGLTALSEAGQQTGAATSAAASAASGSPAGATPAEILQSDVYEVELRPFEGVEYKYRLEAGAALVYWWRAAEVVRYEFHGEPDGAPAKYYDSYGKGDALEGRGGFTAQKSGIHGWFWENRGPNRVKLTLHTSGFYLTAIEYRDGDRVERRIPPR